MDMDGDTLDSAASSLHADGIEPRGLVVNDYVTGRVVECDGGCA